MVATNGPGPFGVLLQQYRGAAGLSQEELAERAGLSRRGISDLERGERRWPHPSTVRQLAEALRLDGAARDALLAGARPGGSSTVQLDPRPRPRATGPPPQPDRRATRPGEPGLADAARLPDPLTSFVGRERELADIRRLLGTARLVTLTGPGGVGKTRLAVRAAGELAGAYADGVCFVPLAMIGQPVAPSRDPEIIATGAKVGESGTIVAAAIAQALGIRDTGGRFLVARLVEHLRAKQQLLILDNFEQIRGDAMLIVTLLSQCPGLIILVTSRGLLHIASEHGYDVPPLEVPTGTESIEHLRQVSALRLFVERAKAARSDFELADEAIATIAECCRRLDGLPLAIELAAARVRLLQPRELARLDRLLPVLTGGPRDLPARQQTLRDTIAWSLDLLGREEQLLFARLAAFAGGFTVEAAEQVCYPGTPSGGQLLDRLGELVDINLILVPELTEQMSPRYRMLHTIREYGLSCLQQYGEAAVVQRRHAELYLSLVENAQPALATRHQPRALQQLRSEHDNIRAALQWAGTGTQSELEIGLRLASGLWRFWQVEGTVGEGRAWLEDALERPVAVHPAIRARALIAAGELACAAGDLRVAQARCEESLAVCRSRGDRSGTAQSLHVLAWSLASRAQSSADYARAASLQRECLATERELHHSDGEARALHELGEIARYQGDHETSTDYLLQARELRIRLGDAQGLAWTAHCLGWVAFEQGEHERARGWVQEALARWQSLHLEHGAGISATLSLRSRVLWKLGDRASAVADLQQSLRRWPMLRNPEWLAYDLQALAGLTLSGQPDRAGAACAAMLLGAAEALHDDDLPPPVHRRREPDALWSALRTCLDEGALDAIRREAAFHEASDAHRFAAEVAARLLNQGSVGRCQMRLLAWPTVDA